MRRSRNQRMLTRRREDAKLSRIPLPFFAFSRLRVSLTPSWKFAQSAKTCGSRNLCQCAENVRGTRKLSGFAVQRSQRKKSLILGWFRAVVENHPGDAQVFQVNAYGAHAPGFFRALPPGLMAGHSFSEAALVRHFCSEPNGLSLRHWSLRYGDWVRQSKIPPCPNLRLRNAGTIRDHL